MRIQLVIASMICLTIVAAPARAQDRARVGISMGYPASVGLVWNVSERVAIRPEFAFTKNDSTSLSLTDARSDFWTTATGVSALFYSVARDNLRTYVAPRFSFGRTRGESGITSSTTSSYSVAGMFGAQYSLGKRFAAFGEIGLGYTRLTGWVESMLLSQRVRTTSQGNSIGTRTGVGVILFF